MGMHTLSAEELQNVKQVIFGLQKQASVQNDAVCVIIAGELTKYYGRDSVSNQDAFIESCRKYLQACIDGTITPDRNAFMLLCGEKSMAKLNEQGPRVVNVEQPSVQSPKLLFRIGMLGETEANLEENTVAPIDDSLIDDMVGVLKGAKNSTMDLDLRISETDSFAVKAEKLKDAIMGCVPDAVKQEIPDNEYAQALCCAEAYFRSI